jgi:hypothetical protein
LRARSRSARARHRGLARRRHSPISSPRTRTPRSTCSPSAPPTSSAAAPRCGTSPPSPHRHPANAVRRRVRRSVRRWRSSRR